MGRGAVRLVGTPAPVARARRGERVMGRRDGHPVSDRAPLPGRPDCLRARALGLLEPERELVPAPLARAVGARERVVGLGQPAGLRARDHARPGLGAARVPAAWRRSQPVPLDRRLPRLRPARHPQRDRATARLAGASVPGRRRAAVPAHARGVSRRARPLGARPRVVRRRVRRHFVCSRRAEAEIVHGIANAQVPQHELARYFETA